MKKKGRWIPVIGCLMLVLFLAGCGKTIDIQSTAEQEIPSQNQIVVGVSQLGSESMWRTANSASIQQALCKENGYFLLFNNARQKQENQIKAIRSYISQRVDYIVFSPIVEDGWETVLQEAKEKNVKERKIYEKEKRTLSCCTDDAVYHGVRHELHGSDESGNAEKQQAHRCFGKRL